MDEVAIQEHVLDLLDKIEALLHILRDQALKDIGEEYGAEPRR